MLYLPNEEGFTKEVQLIQLEEDCSQKKKLSLAISIYIEIIQDGIIH